MNIRTVRTDLMDIANTDNIVVSHRKAKRSALSKRIRKITKYTLMIIAIIILTICILLLCKYNPKSININTIAIQQEHQVEDYP